MAFQKRPGDWMCPNCNFLIFASKKSCRKCGATKPGKRGGGSDRRNKRTDKPHNEWICSNCRSSNYADRDKCRKCRADRPHTIHKEEAPKSRKDEWFCSNCNTSNYADRDKCRKCRTDRPHTMHKEEFKKYTKSRKDEWFCNDCNTSNYADRDKCRTCDSLKSKPAESKEKDTTDSSDVSLKLNMEIELKLNELKMRHKYDIDLVFIMDCTGSMTDKINAGKETIKNIINDLKNDTNNNINNINFGYIAYRDQPLSESTFITKVFPLTNDVNKMYEYINSFDASGGGDGPEALTEALHESLTKIRYNDNNIKINILICDAPGHGWGCTSYDTYPKGNPNGYDPIKLCYGMSKKGIILYVLGCEPSISHYIGARDILEGMTAITEGYYLPLTNADLLPDLIRNSLKQEINLKFIETFIINMMIKIRIDEGCDDSEKLLNKLDLNVIKQLKMNDKMEIGNIYNGDYDYFNINMIKNTFDDEKKQNMNYVLQNINKNLKQPQIMKFSTKSKFAMKSGDWNCVKCHYHNFANRWFCRTCNHINDTLKNGDWLCTKCNDINFAKNRFCRKCKVTKRPHNGPNIIKRKDNEKENKKQEIKNVKCLVNDDIFNVVLNRIKKQRRFHDWKCKDCKYINFESNKKCRKCGITKTDNFGDWKCNECNFINFGSRNICKECNKPKPTN